MTVRSFASIGALLLLSACGLEVSGSRGAYVVGYAMEFSCLNAMILTHGLNLSSLEKKHRVLSAMLSDELSAIRPDVPEVVADPEYVGLNRSDCEEFVAKGNILAADDGFSPESFVQWKLGRNQPVVVTMAFQGELFVGSYITVCGYLPKNEAHGRGQALYTVYRWFGYRQTDFKKLHAKYVSYDDILVGKGDQIRVLPGGAKFKVSTLFMLR